MNEGNDIKYDVEIRKQVEGSYNSNDKNNYQHPAEIMVTITLNEYRELVEIKASHKLKYDELQSEKWKRESELTKEIERLKNKLLADEPEETEETEETDL